MSKKEKKKDPDKAFTEILCNRFKASFSIIWLYTNDESRAMKLVMDAARATGRKFASWTSVSGLTDEKGKPVSRTVDPLDVLNYIQRDDGRCVFVLVDLHQHMKWEFESKGAAVVRALKNLTLSLTTTVSTIVIISPVLPPSELKKRVHILNLPLPSSEVFESAIFGELGSRGLLDTSSMERSELASALCGATYEEAEDIIAAILAENGRIDISVLPEIRQARASLFKETRGLDLIELNSSIPDLGGLRNIKQYLQLVKPGFTKEGRNYGLEPPGGILIIGVPGTGKSLTAKAAAREFGVPLVRLDMGAVMEKFVGSSEENFRGVQAAAEALSPCVTWIDEMEKSLGRREHFGDSATPNIHSSFLTWMQERKGAIFFVATANDIHALPPEYTRKGRFDEIFFVDVPSFNERKEILRIHLKHRKKEPKVFSLDLLAQASEGYTGAEIEQAIKFAMNMAFNKKEDMDAHHIIEELGKITPISVARAEEIEKQREWARRGARPSS